MASINKHGNLLNVFLTGEKFHIPRHVFMLFVLELFAIQNTYKGFNGMGLVYANLVNLFTLASMIYFNIYLLVPYLLLRNKIPVYFTCVSVIIFFTIAVLVVFQGIVYKYYGTWSFSEEGEINFSSFLYAFMILGFMIAGSSTIVVYKRSVLYETKKNQLEKLTIVSELNQLKNRINPHFLFNMLNNSNQLIMDDPEEASKVLHILNDLLRYQYTDSSQNEVLLSYEIDFLANYLNLEKIRHDELEFSISIEGNINKVSIPPLIFITFVENAVKHNSFNSTGPYIKLLFMVQDKKLIFICKNSKTEKNLKDDTTGGSGLINLKRRLDILYNKEYEMIINDTTEKYEVQLTLKI